MRGDFNMLRWWKEAKTATPDRKRNILEALEFPRLPHVVENALFLINSTSCRFERDYSAISLNHSKQGVGVEVEVEQVPEIRDIKRDRDNSYFER